MTHRPGAPASGGRSRGSAKPASDGAAPRERKSPNLLIGAVRFFLVRSHDAPARSAGLRPASRGSAKPALMALHHGNARAPTSSSAQYGFPVRSHDAPARSAGLRPASRGSAKPALMALHHGNARAPTSSSAQYGFPVRSHDAPARSAGLRPASRGSAKPALMALHHGNARAPTSSSAQYGFPSPRKYKSPATSPPLPRPERSQTPKSKSAPPLQPRL